MQTERPYGFTLVELMVVIAIVGILASIAAPQYRQYMRQATVTGIKSATAPIKTQIESCYSLNNGPGPGNMCNTVPVGAPVVRGQVTSAALIRAANSSSVFTIELVPGAQPQIKVNPFEDRGILATDVYYLTGSLNAKGNGIVSWLESGPMCDKGYC